MTVIDVDSIFIPESLQYEKYQQLISMLEENHTWKLIAEYFGVFSPWEIRNLMAHNNKAAEKFLYELGARLCTVEIFCSALETLRLYNILMLFKNYSPLQIIDQTVGPGCGNAQLIEEGKSARLYALASGMPPPQYQWFHNNLALEEQNQSSLNITDFEIKYEGTYYCLIQQEGYTSKKSNAVILMLAPKCPSIIKEPIPCEVSCLGSKVTLNVEAKGHPKLNYQWYKENEELEGFNSPSLTVELTDKSKCGKYKCFIHNLAGEVWTNESVITLNQLPVPELSAKVALLISNHFYENLSTLYKPENDVKTLSELFKNLGYFVMSLQNLNLVEMRNAIRIFTDLIPPNAYVIFYFAGHGIEIYDKFMLPVDTPGPDDYLQSDGICERELLKTILSSNPKVFVELLDMCLKPPNASNKKIFQEVPGLFEFEANNNLIQGYSTSSNLGAYEKRTGSNGLYVEHFKKYLNADNDLPIVEILQKVAKDVASVSPKQKPFFGTNVTSDYRFNDPCNSSSSLKEKFEELSLTPKDTLLTFKNVNVVSNVSFSPHQNVFLNTLEIRLTGLSDFRVSCETAGKDLNFELIRDNKNLIIKVMNLQRLVKNKKLSLILLQNDKEIDRADLDIDKPLIAAADLWKNFVN